MNYRSIQMRRLLSSTTVRTLFNILIIVMPVLLAVTTTDAWKSAGLLDDSVKKALGEIATWATLLVVGLYLVYALFVGAKRIYDVDAASIRAVIDAQRAMTKYVGEFDIDYEDVGTYLKRLHQMARDFVHPNISFVDLMSRYWGTASCQRVKYLGGDSLREKTSDWLEIVETDIHRTTELRLIPVDIGGRPWPGAGMAFSTNGIIYVDRFLDRISFYSYGMDHVTAAQIRMLYSEWEREHFFASIVSIAIPKSSRDKSSIGVLNLNFRNKYPFGRKEALSTGDRMRIEDLFSPHVFILSRLLAAFSTRAPQAP